MTGSTLRLARRLATLAALLAGLVAAGTADAQRRPTVPTLKGQAPPPAASPPAAAPTPAAEAQPAAPSVPATAGAPAADPAAPAPPAAVELPPPTLAVGLALVPPAALAAPADPVAAAAYATLETHCARCHQGGRLTVPTPAGGFGNVLRLDELAREPSLVQPGNPDGSRLYTYVQRRLMPFDSVRGVPGAHPTPTADELQTLRTWIEQLPPVADAANCGEHALIGPSEITKALTAAAQAAANAAIDPVRLRFLSIAHLHNACASPADLFAARQALQVLVNSLSWKPKPVKLEPVDAFRTLYRLDLDDLGWLPAHWDRILKSDPHAEGGLAVLVTTEARAPFGTPSPVARADWFADTALTSPLYYDLLGLPALANEVSRILHLELDGQRRAGTVDRATVRKSLFSRAGRVIERLRSDRAALWTTYDAVTREGATAPVMPGLTPTAHEAELGLFALPNGFPAFFVAGPRGERLDQVPTDIARLGVRGHGPLRPGASCLGCHALGPLAPAAEGDATPEISRLVGSDRAAVKSALMGLGLDPDFTRDGVPAVTLLAREHGRRVGLLRAAGELGIPAARLRTLTTESSPAATLARRLAQGTVGRGELDARLPELANALGLAVVGDAARNGALPVGPEKIDRAPEIELVSDKPVYARGEKLSLTVRTSTDCHLMLVGIDQKGRGTVLYPSDFEPANLLIAGRELKLPAEGAPYSFRLNQTGRERIVAICSPSGGRIDGVKHDFERQRFTDLGSYAAFIGQAYTQGAALPHGAVATAPPPAAKGRRRGPERVQHQPETTARPEDTARTAIVLEIR